MQTNGANAQISCKTHTKTSSDVQTCFLVNVFALCYKKKKKAFWFQF